MAELKIDITKAVEEIIKKLNAEGYEVVKHGKWNHEAEALALIREGGENNGTDNL